MLIAAWLKRCSCTPADPHPQPQLQPHPHIAVAKTNADDGSLAVSFTLIVAGSLRLRLWLVWGSWSFRMGGAVVPAVVSLVLLPVLAKHLATGCLHMYGNGNGYWKEYWYGYNSISPKRRSHGTRCVCGSGDLQQISLGVMNLSNGMPVGIW